MPPEAETASDWLALARRELAFLDSIAAAFSDMVLLHAQQVVEKALKAVIWSTGAQPPFTHSIETLLARLPLNVSAPLEVEQAVWLSEMYIVARYYADEPAPTDDQITEARAAAGAVIVWATLIVEG